MGRAALSIIARTWQHCDLSCVSHFTFKLLIASIVANSSAGLVLTGLG
jgi:hypothetical protein